ncbi:MAG: erythronate-4-phosphate dehydrogenase [Ignavibacteriaceae bacterium]|nr:MAG: erythronate-4-phosphate dehydrogenase [Ignavibacteriaceae bacterium]
MKIILDENIENAREAFGTLGETFLYHGRQITREVLLDADALVVRSITHVNRELLEGTRVKFVGTATIGTDHIDQAWLEEIGTGFTSAKGCNSDAVAEYVFTTMFRAAVVKGISLAGKTIGIVGCGNIGSRVERIGKAFGFEVVLSDPPRERAEGSAGFSPLDEVLGCDVVTFHTPLNRGGADNTFHLLNAEKMKLLKPGAIVINASRGEVIDNKAFIRAIDEKGITAIMDVWEGEPRFMPEMLERSFIASPHVAGYSLEGKINGTTMVYDALCDFLGMEKKWRPHFPPVEEGTVTFRDEGGFEKTLERIFTSVYEPGNDTELMREASDLNDPERGARFDELRKYYPLRREFNNYTIKGDISAPLIKAGLEALRFRF